MQRLCERLALLELFAAGCTPRRGGGHIGQRSDQLERILERQAALQAHRQRLCEPGIVHPA